MVAPPAAPRAAPDLTLVDTHSHLNDRRFASDCDQVVQRATAAGVRTMLVVGFDLASSERAIALAHNYPFIWATVGIHPHRARDADHATLDTLARLAGDARVVAIGECGLDFYRDLSPRAKQIEAFGEQLALAQRLGLPVVVHSREAMSATFDVLAHHPLPEAGVMHCFDGSAADAKRALDLGMFISCAGPLTYRKDPTLAKAIASVPADRLVVETDCPWLSPAGHRGERNEPANVRVVAEAVARVRGERVERVAELTSRNAATLFRTPAIAGAAFEAVA